MGKDQACGCWDFVVFGKIVFEQGYRRMSSVDVFGARHPSGCLKAWSSYFPGVLVKNMKACEARVY